MYELLAGWVIIQNVMVLLTITVQANKRGHVSYYVIHLSQVKVADTTDICDQYNHVPGWSQCVCRHGLWVLLFDCFIETKENIDHMSYIHFEICSENIAANHPNTENLCFWISSPNIFSLAK